MGAMNPRDSPSSLPQLLLSGHAEADSAAHPEPVALEGLGSRHEGQVSPGGTGQQPKMGGLAGLQNFSRGAGEGEGLEWGGGERCRIRPSSLAS